MAASRPFTNSVLPTNLRAFSATPGMACPPVQNGGRRPPSNVAPTGDGARADGFLLRPPGKKESTLDSKLGRWFTPRPYHQRRGVTICPTPPGGFPNERAGRTGKGPTY